MSEHALQAHTPSLVQVLKQLSREWKTQGERKPDVDGDQKGRMQRFLSHPIWTLFRLIKESTSFPRNDLEHIAYYIDRPLERTPPKLPGGRFVWPDNSPELDGIPEDYATGRDLEHLRMIHEELQKCDSDGRTAHILARLESAHPGMFAAHLKLETKDAADQKNAAATETGTRTTGGGEPNERTSELARLSDPVALLLGVFTNGVFDDRIIQATEVLGNDNLSANAKLTKINKLIPFPGNASAELLGEMLGVSKQAVLKTPWWIENRKGEKENEIGRRRAMHQQRAEADELTDSIEPDD